MQSDEQQASAILQEARKLLLEAGYERMTMDAVAGRCRMSKRTIYKLFPSKQALLTALIEDHRASVFGLPGDYDHLPVEQALAQIFRVDIDGEEDVERWALLRVLKAESGKSEELLGILKANTADKIPQLLSGWLAAQTSTGRLAVREPDASAKILLDMMFSCIFDKHGKLCDWPDATKRRRHMHLCIDIFVNGSRTR
jgi:AcrR family transcriptional regulator